jgi:hypothetical protein
MFQQCYDSISVCLGDEYFALSLPQRVCDKILFNSGELCRRRACYLVDI